MEQKTAEEEEEIVLSPSMCIILENPLYEIDPLLLIRICSLLDMLSVMRFKCTSLRISKFLQKNIKLQSLDQTSTDYVISWALHQHNDKAREVRKEDEVISIYSELMYRFPNNYQYDHYILLETDKNIFSPFQRIKQLHLKILPPKATQAVFNPSSSYFEEKQKEEDAIAVNMNEQKETEEDEDTTPVNMNYLLLNSAKKRFAASRAPITKVETSIYSRSIFAYFDCYLDDINHLIIEFDPYVFDATFLTFNIPKILSRIQRLSLIKCVSDIENMHTDRLLTSSDIYCHECVSLLQYTRNIKELIFNFPLSSDFYPIINNLESLKVMHRVEQPFISILESISASAPPQPSAYAQNIVTMNRNKTTMISNVKLQKSLIRYFSPWIESLHLHGSKGLQSLSQLSDEELSENVENKNKVFFGLTELCIHCSNSIYEFIAKYMSVVPQLRRLQIIFGRNSHIYDLELILNHFNSNCVLNLSYNEERDNLFSYYYNYYIYYGFNLSNCAKQLRFLYLITKKTSHHQNYQLLVSISDFFKRERKITLLHIMLRIEYSYWCTSDLMNVIEFVSKNEFVFARHSMNYEIVMPLKRQYSVPSTSSVENKLKNIHNDYKYKQNDKYHAMPSDTDTDKANANVIDKNSLKGIASYVKQKNVGELMVISSHSGMRDDDIVIITKLVNTVKSYEAYNEIAINDDRDERQVYKEKISHKLLKSDAYIKTSHDHENWINECYYCDLLALK